MFFLFFNGNIMIVFIVLVKLYMRFVINCFIVNMVIVDFFMMFSVMFYLVVYMYVKSCWFGGIMGMIMCKIF